MIVLDTNVLSEALRPLPAGKRRSRLSSAIGKLISQIDAMIASICRSRDAAIATRNIGDFEHCGLPIIDPWNA
jgi:predicted nucleic acid-binding protein